MKKILIFTLVLCCLIALQSFAKNDKAVCRKDNINNRYAAKECFRGSNFLAGYAAGHVNIRQEEDTDTSFANNDPCYFKTSKVLYKA